MIPFGYARPIAEAAALQAGAAPGVEYIAGGTGMVDLLRLGVKKPSKLVDLNALPWTAIEVKPDGSIFVGALVKNSDLAWHPEVRARFPVLSEALLAGASPQLRNMASVGGNLMQQTRCSYFRDVGVAACNKRAPGSGCAAMDGFVRMHAVLGGSEQCIAVHPSDMCVALVALEAVVHVRGLQGERTIPIGDFHLLPGAHPEVETALARGEIVSGVTLPPSRFGARSSYVKARDRVSYAFALASAAAALHVEGGQIRDARIALGGVATKPWRSKEAEQLLMGQPAKRATYERAAAAAMAGARTRPGNEYKVALAQRVIVRSLERAGGAA